MTVIRSRFVLALAKALGGLAIVLAIFVAVGFGLSLADGRHPRDFDWTLLTVPFLLIIGIPLYVFGAGGVPNLLGSSKAEQRQFGYVRSFWLVFVVLPAVVTLLATQSLSIAFSAFVILALALTEGKGLSRPLWRLWSRLWKVEP